MVTVDDVAHALEHQSVHGGRLGENLVAIGAITQAALDSFIHRLPTEPADIEATGIDGPDLMQLLGSMCMSATLTEDQAERLLLLIQDGLRPQG